MRIGRSHYWMGWVILWLLALTIAAALSFVEALQGVGLALAFPWAYAATSLICGRLTDAGAPWALGLLWVILPTITLAAAAFLILSMWGGAAAETAAWKIPAAYALLIFGLAVGVLGPLLIGFLKPRPRPHPVA